MKLEEAGLSQRVEVIEETSATVLPRFLAQGQRFGMIYIDGSHLFEDVFIDAYFCMRLIDERGHILFDDSTDPHVAKVLAFIDTSVPGLNHQAELTFRHRVAKLLGKRQLTVYRRIGCVERVWNAPLSAGNLR